MRVLFHRRMKLFGILIGPRNDFALTGRSSRLCFLPIQPPEYSRSYLSSQHLVCLFGTRTSSNTCGSILCDVCVTLFGPYVGLSFVYCSIGFMRLFNRLTACCTPCLADLFHVCQIGVITDFEIVTLT